MANIKSAKKAAKQSEKRRQVNLARKTAIKSSAKAVLDALAQNADDATIKKLLVAAEAKIARAKSKQLMHPKAASRKVSRLAKKVAAAVRAKRSS
jgi:small subunit ribosomal protein S20